MNSKRNVSIEQGKELMRRLMEIGADSSQEEPIASKPMQTKTESKQRTQRPSEQNEPEMSKLGPSENSGSATPQQTRSEEPKSGKRYLIETPIGMIGVTEEQMNYYMANKEKVDKRWEEIAKS